MATSRSLKLSSDGKRQVDRVLTDKAWGNKELIEAVGVEIATVKKFRAGKKGVDRKNFVKFCKALGLDWEAVAELESPQADNNESFESGAVSLAPAEFDIDAL
jgi:DNA-binding Xre family transcriptional regulator